ncbi:4394_t:CDS:2 [Ambispora leptoticha]|uniref:4394_t:CDS:1 n=1 Tax=Ambispora leptoticha TaxID=144679 RepID=A0A9N9BW01_9GLOM|nr:4394_t:CDS:2 [Ambispora leptoticha]
MFDVARQIIGLSSNEGRIFSELRAKPSTSGEMCTTLEKRGFGGKATYYNPSLGSCGQENSDSDFICALNKPQWGNPSNPNANPLCGKKIIVHGPLGSVTVTVQDSCPNCGFGDLDLTLAAFNKIGDSNAGFVPITWDWADESGDQPLSRISQLFFDGIIVSNLPSYSGIGKNFKSKSLGKANVDLGGLTTITMAATTPTTEIKKKAKHHDKKKNSKQNS